MVLDLALLLDGADRLQEGVALRQVGADAGGGLGVLAHEGQDGAQQGGCDAGAAAVLQHAAPDGHVGSEVGEVGRALPPQPDAGDAEDGRAVEGDVAFVAPKRHVLAQGVLDLGVGQDGFAGDVLSRADAAERVVGGPFG